MEIRTKKVINLPMRQEGVIMKELYGLMVSIVKDSQSAIGFNLPLLVLTLAILLLALAICIHISRKNKLYIKSDKQEPLIGRYKENEVVS